MLFSICGKMIQISIDSSGMTMGDRNMIFFGEGGIKTVEGQEEKSTPKNRDRDGGREGK